MAQGDGLHRKLIRVPAELHDDFVRLGRLHERNTEAEMRHALEEWRRRHASVLARSR